MTTILRTRTSQPQSPVGVTYWAKNLAILYTPSTSVNHIGGYPLPKPVGITSVSTLMGSALGSGSWRIPTKVTNPSGDHDTVLVYWKPTASSACVGSAVTNNSGVTTWVGMSGTYPNRTITANALCHGQSDVRGAVAISGLDGKYITTVWSGVGSGTCACYINGKFTENLNTALSSSIDTYNIGTSVINTPAFVNAEILLVAVWKNRKLSAAEVKLLNSNPWQIFEPEARRVFTSYDSPSYIDPPAPPPTQAVSVSFISSTENFYTHSIAVGTALNNLAVDFFDHSNVFYAPSAAAGQVNLIAPAISQTNSFNTQVINPGVVTSAVPYLPHTNSFNTPVITSGALNLVAPVIPSNNTFNVEIVNPGAVGTNAPIYTNSSTLYAPSIQARNAVTAPYIGHTNSFNSQVIAPGVVVSSVPYLAANNTFNAHSLQRGAVTLVATRYDANTVFYDPSMDGGQFPYTPSLRTYLSASRNNVLHPLTRTNDFLPDARNTATESEARNTSVASNDRDYLLVAGGRTTNGESNSRTTMCDSGNRTLVIVSSSRTT